MQVAEYRRQIGADTIGPILGWYVRRLDHHLRIIGRRGGVGLFVARAGLRLEHLHERYLEAAGISAPAPVASVWASRLLLCKGYALRHPDVVQPLFERYFRSATIGTLAAGLWRHEPELLVTIDPSDPLHDAPVELLPTAVEQPSTPLGVALAGYFEDYATLVDDYFAQLGVDADLPVVALIDSGWQGTMHRLAKAGLPCDEVLSLYLGSMQVDPEFDPPGPEVHALITSGATYDPTRPETAIVFYRHLVESLLEPACSSSETLKRDASGRVWCPHELTGPVDGGNGPADELFRAAVDHVVETVDQAPAAALEAFEAAASRLADLIMWPDERTVEALAVGSRSSDFGRDSGVDVPLPVVDRSESDTPARRIHDSLWPQAQAIAELGESESPPVLRELAGGLTAASYFDPTQQAADASRVVERPTVTVVTRTKDRSVLLRRAAESVARQSFQDYEWVVVNDGGDDPTVRAVIEASAVDPSRTTLVSNAVSQGMEAASNLGVRADDGTYVVIHDDDDSWEPEFLQATTDFLGTARGAKYGGVITGTRYVQEVVRGDHVEIVEERPYNAWVRSVEFPELLSQNLFAPIAFLFRRDLYEKVGGFDETLPVLGDWDFNLRFIRCADIGVIPDVLANYHHRVEGSSITHSNSVAAGRDKHVEFRAILLNRYLRGNLDDSFGSMALMGVVLDRLRNEVRQGKVSLEEAAGVSTATVGPGLADAADDRWLALAHLAVSQESPARRPGRRDRGGPDRTAVTAKIAEWVQTALADDSLLDRVPIPRDFDEDRYLADNPDVLDAVREGHFGSGYEHYLRFGRHEGRARPS